MARTIDRALPLGDATEHDLLIALGDIWKGMESRQMTRSSSVEAHHQLLYAVGRLTDLRNHLEARGAGTDWRHVVLEAQTVINMMSALQEYVTTGKGGLSSLGDRNSR